MNKKEKIEKQVEKLTKPTTEQKTDNLIEIKKEK